LLNQLAEQAAAVNVLKVARNKVVDSSSALKLKTKGKTRGNLKVADNNVLKVKIKVSHKAGKLKMLERNNVHKVALKAEQTHNKLVNVVVAVNVAAVVK
jgi:hypothetical protein